MNRSHPLSARKPSSLQGLEPAKVEVHPFHLSTGCSLSRYLSASATTRFINKAKVAEENEVRVCHGSESNNTKLAFGFVAVSLLRYFLQYVFRGNSH